MNSASIDFHRAAGRFERIQTGDAAQETTMAFLNDTGFEDDFRTVGPDATATFEPGMTPNDATTYANSENLALAPPDDLEDEEEDEEDDDLEEEEDDDLEDEEDDEEFEDDDDEDDEEDLDDDEDE
jgi:hypothetical protein